MTRQQNAHPAQTTHAPRALPAMLREVSCVGIGAGLVLLIEAGVLIPDPQLKIAHLIVGAFLFTVSVLAFRLDCLK